MTKEQKNRITAMGFDASSEEKSREAMLEFLKEQGVDGVAEEDTQDLIDYCEALQPDEDEVEQEVEEIEELEEEEEELVEEEDEGEEESEEELLEELAAGFADYTEADLKKKTVAELREIAPEDAKGKKADLIAAILAAQSGEEEEEGLGEIPADIVTKPAPVVKKTVLGTGSGPDNMRKINTPLGPVMGRAFDGRNRDDDAQMIDDIFGELLNDTYAVKILKVGFTVRADLENTAPTIFNFDTLKVVMMDGELKLYGDLYCNRLKNPEELIEMLPDEFADYKIGMFRGESHPSIKGVFSDDVINILTEGGILAESLKRAQRADKVSGIKRAEIEESLEEAKPEVKVKTTTAKKPAAAAKAKAKPVAKKAQAKKGK